MPDDEGTGVKSKGVKKAGAKKASPKRAASASPARSASGGESPKGAKKAPKKAGKGAAKPAAKPAKAGTKAGAKAASKAGAKPSAKKSAAKPAAKKAADGNASGDDEPKTDGEGKDGSSAASSPCAKSRKNKRPKKSEETLAADLFALVDVDNGGTLDRSELERLIKIVDPKAPNMLIEEIVNVGDVDRNGEIDKSEFETMCLSGYLGELPSVLLEKYKAGLVRIEKRGSYEKYSMSIPTPPDITQQEAQAVLQQRVEEFLRRTADPQVLFKELFDMCDVSGDGSLSHTEVSKMIRLVMPGVGTPVVNAVIQSADKDGNGDIDFEEFQIAIEEGSFGMTAEELLPSFQRAIRKKKDLQLLGKEDEDDKDHRAPVKKEDMDKAMQEVKRMQQVAEEKRKQTKVDQADQKRRRLRSRLVDFYARHNPEKVREDEIARVVDAAITKHIDEDDLFRALYRKYNLDESGEPIAGSEESDWDASSEEVDESQLTEEERKELEKRRELREEYRRQKKEEAMHKAVQQQIKREAAEERAQSREARKRFIDGWKSADERKKEAEEELQREKDAAAEAAIKRNEDIDHRRRNRKVWLEAVENAKDQRFEELSVKVEQKRTRKKIAARVSEQRHHLKEALQELSDEYNRQIAFSQNIRVMHVILGKQRQRITPPSEAELEELLEKTRGEIDDIRSKMKGLRSDRWELLHMMVANKQYRRVLEKITDSLKRELTERKDTIRTMREDCLEELRTLRAGSHVDLLALEKSLDGSLEAIQADLKRREELRLQDGHLRLARESGIHDKTREYTRQCNSEIKVLKERLLELYPAIITDMTSRMGKVMSPTDIGHVAGPPVPPKPQSPRKEVRQHDFEEVVMSLGLYKPRDVYVRSGGHTHDEMCGVVQVNEEVVFDKHPLQLMGRNARLLTSGQEGASPEELSPCESLPTEMFSAMQSGAIAKHWRSRLGLSPEESESVCSSLTLDESHEKVLPFELGTRRTWEAVTERGATVQISVEVRRPTDSIGSPAPSTAPALASPPPSPGMRTWGTRSPTPQRQFGTTPKPALGNRMSSSTPVRLPPTPPNPPPSELGYC